MMKVQQIQLNQQKQTYENAVRMIRQSLDNYASNRNQSSQKPLVTQQMVDQMKETSKFNDIDEISNDLHKGSQNLGQNDQFGQMYENMDYSAV